MGRLRSRRQLLRVVTGCGVALAGCSSVADRLADGGPGGTPTPARTPERDAGASTPTPEPASPTPTETATTRGTPTPSRSRTAATPAEAARAFADVPIPPSPGDHRYATMGDPAAAPTATVFGSWKCPYTRAFVVDQLGELVDAYVRPGDLAVRFRDVAYRSGEPFLGPDAPRAGRAGLGVWSTDPGAYWPYFAHVFERQPPEREDWATADTLLGFASTAGVDRLDRVEGRLDGTAFEAELQATVDRVAELDIGAVPRVVLDGEVTAPTVDPASTRSLLERAG